MTSLENNRKFKTEVLFEDGSYRDIVILQTDEDAWNKVITFISECYLSELFIEEKSDTLSQYKIRDIFKIKEKKSVHLKILVGDCQLNCHFFDRSEIEIDIDPKDYDSDYKIEELKVFMELLSFMLGKNVFLTVENWHDKPLYIIDFNNIKLKSKKYKKEYLIRKNKRVIKQGFGSLFEECLENLNGNSLSYFQSERIQIEFRNKFNECKFIKEVKSTGELADVINEYLREEGYLIWDNAELPVMKVKLDKLGDYLDDICAVSFHTWLFFNEGKNIVKLKN